MTVTHGDANENHLCLFRASVIVTEALCWEVCLSMTLFIFALFHSLCQLSDTPIPGISGGLIDFGFLMCKLLASKRPK